MKQKGQQASSIPKVRFFGGQLLQGKRRSRRPLSKKEAFHLVMRSSWAKGPYSFLQPKNRTAIQAFINIVASKHKIRIYQRAIVGNHIHLVLRSTRRKRYRAFIRSLSSQIATHIMQNQSFKDFRKQISGEGSKNLETQGKGQRFWQFRPFTRVLFWGRDFRGCCKYVVQNTLEALGFIEYSERKESRYTRWIGLAPPRA